MPERVTVDPAFAITASADDVVILSPSTFSASSTGVTAGVSAAGAIYQSAMRFSLPIPRGSTILTAKVTFLAAFTRSGTTCNTDLFFEAADNAAVIANYNDFTGRSLGSAVAWDGIGTWTAGDASTYDSPDIASILQTVTDRPGWAISNYVNLFWKDGGSSTNAYRQGASWDNTSYTEPILTVTWTSPARGPYGFVF